MTTAHDTILETITDQPHSPLAYWAGWLSLAISLECMIMIFMGDPLWLSLPGSALAVLVGLHALRRGQSHHLGAHLGLNLGLFNLLLWLLLIVLWQLVLGMHVWSIFEIPSYE